ncbi:hypothetical protein D4R51_04145 [bacterium]|nr:MAG: hypothetical protein D4R51_04145 [bacterium]
MNDQIIRQLKKLKAIEPDPHFVAGSRRMILAFNKQELVFAWPSLRMAGVFAGIIAVLTTSIFLFSGNSASTALASPEDLNREFSNMNINIELKEIEYRQNVNQTIASAITEISNNNLSHLNQDILKSEGSGLDLNAFNSDSRIDQLLDKIIQ